MDINRFKLENLLILYFSHVRSLELKAYFKATKDLHFDGQPHKYVTSLWQECKADLYRIEWKDIDDGKYSSTPDKAKVKHFYVDGRLGLATIEVNHSLS